LRGEVTGGQCSGEGEGKSEFAHGAGGYHDFNTSEVRKSEGEKIHSAEMVPVYDAAYQRMLARLRQARGEAGLTQAEVCVQIKKPLNYISRVESGARRIDPVELAELARVYGEDVGWFLKTEEEGGMSKTFREGLSFDIATGELTYLCSCGMRIALPVEALVPDEFVDYHGCGAARISFTADQIAHYRKRAGLPQLGK
jgi:transcriptional regulator with XRE-family HTH domain